MLFIKLLSEGGPNAELAWLLWIVLGIFALAIVVGWVASLNKGSVEEPVRAHSNEKHDDDLKIIEGIGPKVSKILNDGGIHSFADLAHADPEKLNELLKSAKLNMMNVAGWIEQAALAARGDMAGLKKMQEEMKGGRRV